MLTLKTRQMGQMGQRQGGQKSAQWQLRPRPPSLQQLPPLPPLPLPSLKQLPLLPPSQLQLRARMPTRLRKTASVASPPPSSAGSQQSTAWTSGAFLGRVSVVG